jgi:hypothetical protein
MRRLRNRKGVFVVLFGILFMALMGAAAIAIDFSRIWTMRNELQTAADAAALAGAVQLSTPPGNTPFKVDSVSRRFSAVNKAMGVAPVVNEVTLGLWDDINPFDAAGNPKNAVRVTVSHPTNGLIMSALGITAPTVRASAIAWADAPISTTNCIRPWAIPYEVLMGRVNPLRTDDPSISGDPYSRDNLTRAFDPVLDMNALRGAQASNPDALQFTLKLGQNDNAQNGQIDTPTLVNGQPGNFQAVVLPKTWDYATQSATIPAPQRGGAAYVDAISGRHCYGLAVGDSLLTESGNKTGITVSAADKSDPQTAPFGVCESIVDAAQGQNVDLAIHGNCMNSSGGVGVEMKAAFFFCPSSCQGRSTVAVSLLGSFTLEKIYPDGDGGNAPRWDKSQIVGKFNPVSDIGPVGGSSTTLRKVILVK